MGDTAMSVDPQGDTVFEVTDVVLAMGEDAVQALRNDDLPSDHVLDAQNAPCWVKG